MLDIGCKTHKYQPSYMCQWGVGGVGRVWWCCVHDDGKITQTVWTCESLCSDTSHMALLQPLRGCQREADTIRTHSEEALSLSLSHVAWVRAMGGRSENGIRGKHTHHSR